MKDIDITAMYRNFNILFELTEEQQAIYNGFFEQIANIKVKQLEYLRRCYREIGIIGRLASLRSENGRHFSIQPNEPMDFDCRRAGNGVDTAYLCETREHGGLDRRR